MQTLVLSGCTSCTGDDTKNKLKSALLKCSLREMTEVVANCSILGECSVFELLRLPNISVFVNIFALDFWFKIRITSYFSDCLGMSEET